MSILETLLLIPPDPMAEFEFGFGRKVGSRQRSQKKRRRIERQRRSGKFSRRRFK